MDNLNVIVAEVDALLVELGKARDKVEGIADKIAKAADLFPFFGSVVCGEKVGAYDGFIRILCGDKGKTICLTADGTEKDEFVTLNDCLRLIDYKEGEDGTVFVIIDDFMRGSMYCYGNHGAQWEYYGETMGFS